MSDLETFAPVVRFETVRTALSHAAHDDLELWSADVCSAYILSPLQPGQKVYMNDPNDPKGDTVLELKKSLYGLKSSARAWNNHFHKWLISKKQDYLFKIHDSINNWICGFYRISHN